MWFVFLKTLYSLSVVGALKQQTRSNSTPCQPHASLAEKQQSLKQQCSTHCTISSPNLNL